MANVSINNITETWSSSGTTYTGIKYNVTDSGPSAAGSKLIDLQVGGVSKFSVGKDGSLGTFIADIMSNSSGASLRLSSGGRTTLRGSGAGNIVTNGWNIGNNSTGSMNLWTGDTNTANSGDIYFGITGTLPENAAVNGSGSKGALTDYGFKLASTSTIRWTSTSNAGRESLNPIDLVILRDEPNTLAQRNGINNPQSYRLYLSYTDATNNSRFAINATANYYRLASEIGTSTGSKKPIVTDIYQSTVDPTTTDIPDGTSTVWKNTTSGVVKLWANNGGTLIGVALA